MNVVLKNIDKKIKKKRISKNEKIVIENTKKFCKKYSIKIIDNRIDYLTIKIKKTENIEILENSLETVYNFDYIKTNKIEHLQSMKIFNKFYIINNGLAFGNQKKSIKF